MDQYWLFAPCYCFIVSFQSAVFGDVNLFCGMGFSGWDRCLTFSFPLCFSLMLFHFTVLSLAFRPLFLSIIVATELFYCRGLPDQFHGCKALHKKV